MTTQIRVLSPPCPGRPSRVVRAAHQHIDPRTRSGCNPRPSCGPLDQDENHTLAVPSLSTPVVCNGARSVRPPGTGR
jgi:hypothetical protein